MSFDISQTALMVYLNAKGQVYHGKVLELREAVQNWLDYIPATFPHYTRHTVRHSEEIVLQISKLLFKDEDPNQIVIPLTAVEAYCLIAANGPKLKSFEMMESQPMMDSAITSPIFKFDFLLRNSFDVYITCEQAGYRPTSRSVGTIRI